MTQILVQTKPTNYPFINRSILQMKLLKAVEEEYLIRPTQDGNFRGRLFVEQATGIASLNADAFNTPGLQELQLGDLALGGTSASSMTELMEQWRRIQCQ